eukprot:scpid40938/ scgid4890/ Hemicentin-1; Fibulin-6
MGASNLALFLTCLLVVGTATGQAEESSLEADVGLDDSLGEQSASVLTENSNTEEQGDDSLLAALSSQDTNEARKGSIRKHNWLWKATYNRFSSRGRKATVGGGRKLRGRKGGRKSSAIKGKYRIVKFTRGQCSVTCGSGFRSDTVLLRCRKRGNCLQDTIQRRTRRRPCRQPACPFSDRYVLTSYMLGECSVTCGTGVMVEARLYKCSKKSVCKKSEYTKNSTLKCTRPKCPPDAKYSVAEKRVGECSRTCGAGVKVIKVTVACVGQDCWKPRRVRTYVRSCRLRPCPVSEWQRFGKYSECSSSCGRGVQSRQRACSTGNASECSGGTRTALRWRFCRSTPCRELRLSTSWTAWSDCTAQCGYGVQSRTRFKQRDCNLFRSLRHTYGRRNVFVRPQPLVNMRWCSKLAPCNTSTTVSTSPTAGEDSTASPLEQQTTTGSPLEQQTTMGSTAMTTDIAFTTKATTTPLPPTPTPTLKPTPEAAKTTGAEIVTTLPEEPETHVITKPTVSTSSDETLGEAGDILVTGEEPEIILQPGDGQEAVAITEEEGEAYQLEDELADDEPLVASSTGSTDNKPSETNLPAVNDLTDEEILEDAQREDQVRIKTASETEAPANLSIWNRILNSPPSKDGVSLAQHETESQAKSDGPSSRNPALAMEPLQTQPATTEQSHSGNNGRGNSAVRQFEQHSGDTAAHGKAGKTNRRESKPSDAAMVDGNMPRHQFVREQTAVQDIPKSAEDSSFGGNDESDEAVNADEEESLEELLQDLSMENAFK